MAKKIENIKASQKDLKKRKENLIKKSSVKKAPEPEIKKKGVKIGTKRGSYKKNKETTTHDDFLKGVNETIDTKTSVNETKEIIGNDNNNPNNNTDIINNNIVNIPINNDTLKNDDVTNEQFENFVNENQTDEEFKPIEITDIQNISSAQNQQLDKQQFAHLVNGYMLLSLIDFVFPFFILKILKVVNKSEAVKQIKMSEIKLTNDQKLALKESADIIAKMVFDKLSPETVFIFGLSLFYFDNVSTVLEDRTKEKLKS